MLTHPSYERLIALGLTGMAKALEEQRRQPDHTALDFEERRRTFACRRRENRRVAERKAVAIKKITHGFDDRVADLQDRVLLLRAQP